MNLKKKSILRFPAMMAMVMAVLPGFGQTEEQIEEFNKKREEFFTERLSLTEQESKAFWPMYYDYFNRKMKLAEDERNTFKYCHKNADNLTQEEFEEALAKIRTLKSQQYKLEDEYYHEKFTGVLPARKVMMLYKVEWDFRNHLLKELRNHKEGGQDSRGRNGGGAGPGPGFGWHELPASPPCSMRCPSAGATS
ncbi:MAG: hypothetical protein EHM46_05125 [Bacteroidetes bacterium]|nr:MAG: hypothetical protein EHM46_05125 [Bacteroidota bacterium]